MGNGTFRRHPTKLSRDLSAAGLEQLGAATNAGGRSECPHCHGSGTRGLVSDLCPYCGGDTIVSGRSSRTMIPARSMRDVPIATERGQRGWFRTLHMLPRFTGGHPREEKEVQTRNIDEVECPHCGGAGVRRRGNYCEYCRGSQVVSQENTTNTMLTALTSRHARAATEAVRPDGTGALARYVEVTLPDKGPGRRSPSFWIFSHAAAAQIISPRKSVRVTGRRDVWVNTDQALATSVSGTSAASRCKPCVWRSV